MASPRKMAKGTREFSECLGALSEEQMQAALDRFDLGSVAHAECILFGNFGQNVFVTCSKAEHRSSSRRLRMSGP
jgi:hypothetical protein